MANILGKIYDLSTTELFLSNMQITSEMLLDLSNEINKLTNLRYLSLIRNQITSLPENIFNKLAKLEILYLYHNKITGIPENIFNKLTNLEYLDLQDNQITSVPKNTFDKLTKLIHLNIADNQITTEGLQENTFNKLTNLIQLDLYGNKITANNLPRKIFKKLTNLQYFYIDLRYTNDISKRYIRLSKQEKLKEKIKLAKLRTAIFKEELYMKTLHYSKINLFDTSYF
jgi:Leucine-rich repeat (LRR) protein